MNVGNGEHGDSRINLRVIFDSLFDERDGNRTLGPPMLSTERVRVVLKILHDEPVFTVMREARLLRGIKSWVCDVCPEAIEFILRLRVRF